MKYFAEVLIKICFLAALCFIGISINDFFVWLSQVFNPGIRVFAGVEMNAFEGVLIFAFVVIPLVSILWFIFVPEPTEADKKAIKQINKILVDKT